MRRYMQLKGVFIFLLFVVPLTGCGVQEYVQDVWEILEEEKTDTLKGQTESITLAEILEAAEESDWVAEQTYKYDFEQENHDT